MSPADFQLEYWPAEPALAGSVSGYHRYSVTPNAGERHADVFYPGWANIRIQTAGDPWRLRIGENNFDPVPRASLFGPTSHAAYSDCGAGTLVGAGLTPLGWYRLTRIEATEVADRIIPLETVIGAEAAQLAATLAGAAGGDEIKAAFDLFFRRLLRPRRGEDRIAAIHALLAQERHPSVSEAAGQLGINDRSFNRLANAAFGFRPKLLIRRARFLRSLLALREPSDEPWSARISQTYYDHSHFVRDSHDFLGMSPGEFLRLSKPMNEASTRLRHQILGAPAQALLTPAAAESALNEKRDR